MNAIQLYREAFQRFRAIALWNARELDQPTRQDILTTARVLRIEGNLEARKLAEQIESVIDDPH